MGYALFARTKIMLIGEQNCVELQQAQRSNEQLALATKTLGLQQQMSSMQSAQSTQLANEYEKLAKSENDEQRDDINLNIKILDEKFQGELDTIQRQIYQVTLKENIIDMDIKRLDTRLTAIKEQLEAIKQAESDGIKESTPEFNGIS